MKTLTSFFQSKRFYQTIVGCVAVLFLLVNTACSQPKVSESGGEMTVVKATADNKPLKTASPYRKDTDNTPEGQITELYKAIQPEEGGMNNFSDVDPRQNTSKADAKAKKLIKNSSHPEAKRFDSPLDAVKKELADEPISDRLQKFSDNVSEATKKTADGMLQETQKGLDNMSEVSKNLQDKAQEAAENLNKDVQKATKKIG